MYFPFLGSLILITSLEFNSQHAQEWNLWLWFTTPYNNCNVCLQMLHGKLIKHIMYHLGTLIGDPGLAVALR